MDNYGMIEYKESFISKIKKFLKRIFGKNDIQNNNLKEKSNKVPNQEEKSNYQNNFVNGIKIEVKDTNTSIKRNNFLKELEGNEEALNMLSIEKLKKLEKYYDSIIEQNNEKIKKLKKLA